MFIKEHTNTIVKVGPINNRDGTAFNRKRLNFKEVHITDAQGALEPVAEGSQMRVDQDGFYDILVPGAAPGSITIAIFISGLTAHAFEHTVISERAYASMFGNSIPDTKAINVPVRDGHVVTDPNLIVGIDLDRVANKETELDLNLNIKSVGKVNAPHVTDLTKVLSAIRNEGANSEPFIEKVDEIKQCVADTDPSVLKVQLLAIVQGLKAVFDQVLKVQLKEETVDSVIKDNLAGYAKREDVVKVESALGELVGCIESLEIPAVGDFVAAIPIETKDGKVRVVSGTGEGEIALKNGQVVASDVVAKDGYSIGKNGLGRIKSDIINVLKKEVQKLKPPSPVGKKTAMRSSH